MLIFFRDVCFHISYHLNLRCSLPRFAFCSVFCFFQCNVKKLVSKQQRTKFCGTSRP